MGETASGDHPGLKMVNAGAAAIDIGSTMHMAAVNPVATDMPVCLFPISSRIIRTTPTITRHPMVIVRQWMPSSGLRRT